MSNRPSHSHLSLEDGSRVAVVGGGPAGSFFAYFVLQLAERAGLDLAVEIFEPRNFDVRGPKGCNMCGGIVSEALIQRLAAEGLHLPETIIQRRIDSYSLHMDVGSVRISTPLRELRIAAVARGSGPRIGPEGIQGLDGFLINLARERGARHVSERVMRVSMADGHPRVETRQGVLGDYDLLVGACGVNSPLLKNLDLQSFRAPRSTRAYIAEFHLGREVIERHLGSSMHVFLLNLPRLDFAALIPKGEYVTFCMLGEEIDKPLVDAVLEADEVRDVMPPGWKPPADFCHCAPLMNVGAAIQPFDDRVVLVGDSGTTRLFKDGIGAAYRTAKAAARTAVLRGVGHDDFRAGYAPTCRAIEADNRLGHVVFSTTKLLQRTRGARRALWRTTSGEQQLQGNRRRLSLLLWNTFTGSAPYRSVLVGGLHPAVWSRLTWEYVRGLYAGDTLRPRAPAVLASGRTGAVLRSVPAGEVVFERGVRETCMYLVGQGCVELLDGAEASAPLAALGAGDFFGEEALFGEGTRSVTARAAVDTTLYVLELHDLLLRLYEDSSMAFRMIEAAAHRAQKAEAALVRRALAANETELDEPRPEAEEGSPDLPAALLVETGGMGRAYDYGTPVYRQGERGGRMYAITGGRVELIRRDGGFECRTAVLGKGELFGEETLYHTEIRPSTARALGRLHVLTIERDGLVRCIQEDPSVATHLIEQLFRRTARMDAAFARGAPAPRPEPRSVATTTRPEEP